MDGWDDRWELFGWEYGGESFIGLFGDIWYKAVLTFEFEQKVFILCFWFKGFDSFFFV